ncbi:MAG: hypothetical protein HY072_10595, partial [Deltaproteobacteria bacterium]|nr:hypothetical protein [Deltaproteobacteria bacterium]
PSAQNNNVARPQSANQVPAHSCEIPQETYVLFLDNRDEGYNTAKVNRQTGLLTRGIDFLTERNDIIALYRSAGIPVDRILRFQTVEELRSQIDLLNNRQTSGVQVRVLLNFDAHGNPSRDYDLYRENKLRSLMQKKTRDGFLSSVDNDKLSQVLEKFTLRQGEDPNLPESYILSKPSNSPPGFYYESTTVPVARVSGNILESSWSGRHVRVVVVHILTNQDKFEPYCPNTINKKSLNLATCILAQNLLFQPVEVFL